MKYFLITEDGEMNVPEKEFERFWKLCIKEAEKNTAFQYIWKSTDDILEWSYTLLSELQDLI